jgi:hypothetical protein
LLLLLHRLDAKTLLGAFLKVRWGFSNLRRWLIGDLRDASLMRLHKPLLFEPRLLQALEMLKVLHLLSLALLSLV